jgi:two-component system phosphate regulon sensor histidine kinase PhoR
MQAAAAAAAGVLGVIVVLTVPSYAPAVAMAATLAATALAIRHIRDRSRVREIRRVAAAYAAGDLAQRAAVSGTDAVAWLGSELNGLGDRLASARQELEAQRRMLDGALGSLAEGVACVDFLDRVIYANPAWRHLAAGGGETLRAPFYEHLPAAVLSAAVAGVRRSGLPETVEFEHRRRHLSGVVSRLGNESLVLVLHDLTELKRLEGVRRGFVAAVSHELKTPLTAISGFAETLLDGALDDDHAAARGFVEKIARHADRLTVLVRDVLTISRLEQGAWEVRPAPCDLPELGRQLAEEHQPAASDKQVRILLDAPAALDAVTDRELLHQLLANLISNAIRYNRPGGTVTIRVASDGDRLQLAVADTGIGIPAEHRERIFERFYRIDAHRSRASGGTGLGLAIVKHIVDAMRGTIMVDSSADGTVFTVDLPRTDPRAVRQ